jgi:tetratricopeptide (TPR) repeat protein
LNDLQRIHSDVIIVSVYGDQEKAVREFLSGAGRDIAYRVAVDGSQVIWNEWSEAALQVAIPHAFVVDRSGKVAWIGNPADLANPLDRIMAGTFDPSADIIRLKLEQGVVGARRLLREREEQGRAELDRVRKMMIAGNSREALTAIERALGQYDECPSVTDSFKRLKLHLLATSPGGKEEAVMLGTELAIEARLSNRWSSMSNAVKCLLNAVEETTIEDRDQRLVDLAVALLQGDDPADLRGESAGQMQKHRTMSLGELARAYHLRGDHKQAVATIQEALEATKNWKADPREDRNNFSEFQQHILSTFSERLTAYQRAESLPLK